MRIAFVSFEYAGVAGGGGIGTYVRNACAMLHGRGHDVAVFTARTDERGGEFGGPSVYSIDACRAHFFQSVLSVFAAAHHAQPFDVVECAEYGADARLVFEAFPEVARVVKLHTPGMMIGDANRAYLSTRSKARFLLGALRRGRLPRPYWVYKAQTDPERFITLAADEITAPSVSIGEILAARWSILGPIAHVPNVFIAAPSLLEVSAERDTQRVTFVGKLEVRKGIIELAEAIPLVLAKAPGACFRIVGRSLPHPDSGEELRAHIVRMLGPYAASVEFVDAVPYAQIPELLRDTDVCAFPSFWENFPNVCLEAMVAGCGVVGSSSGGMSEMITDGETGRLCPPRDHKALVAAILDLLRDREKRIRMARAARAHVLSTYSVDRIAPIQEASYKRAIERARLRRNPR